MKKIIVFFVFLAAPALLVAQSKTMRPSIGLKWAPTGIFLGSLSLHAEYNFGKNSLTAKIGVPVTRHHMFRYDDKDAAFSMRATSFLAGYRTYLSKKHMKGFYFEPFFKYVHHSSEGSGNAMLDGENVRMNFTNDYNGVGAGVQLGVQFLIRKRMVIDFFFFGPEINAARNNFKAVEVSNVTPWNSADAYQAEQDVRDFIHHFPFIRHHVDVNVDNANKTVRADFKGALPGYRIGISVGVAF